MCACMKVRSTAPSPRGGRGLPLDQLQKAAGHRDARSTEIYAELAQGQATKVLRMAHEPLSNKKEIWSGWWDLNPRRWPPKDQALPLSYTPTNGARVQLFRRPADRRAQASRIGCITFLSSQLNSSRRASWLISWPMPNSRYVVGTFSFASAARDWRAISTGIIGSSVP